MSDKEHPPSRGGDATASHPLQRGTNDLAARVCALREQELVEQYGFEAARTHRLNQDQWRGARGESLNRALEGDASTLYARAEFEQRNNTYMEGIPVTYSSNVVGKAGPMLRITSVKRPGYGKLAERLWRKWWAVCDYDDVAHGPDKFNLMLDQMWPYGEFFEQIVSLPEATAPKDLPRVRLRSIHPKRIETPIGSPSGERIIRGVEFDVGGKILGYWVGEPLENVFNLATTFVPRKDMLHYFEVKEPGQLRGKPWTAAPLQTARDIRSLDDATLDAMRACANMSVLAYQPFNQEYAAPADMSAFNGLTIKRNQFTVAPYGYNIEQMKPEQPGPTHIQYRDERLREMGRSRGIPLLHVKADAGNHNYSSMRFDDQSFRLVLGWDEGKYERNVLNRVLDLVLWESFMLGLLPEPKPADAQIEWVWPARGHVDPQKEAQGQVIQLTNGTKTLHDVCAENGDDYDMLLSTLDREVADFEARGWIHPMLRAEKAVPVLDAPADGGNGGNGGGNGKDSKVKQGMEEEQRELLDHASPSGAWRRGNSLTLALSPEDGGEGRRPGGDARRHHGGGLVMQAEEPAKLDVMLTAVVQKATMDAATRQVQAVVVDQNSRPVTYDWRTDEYVQNVFLMSGYVPVERVPMVDNHNTYDTSALRGSASKFVVDGTQLKTTLEFGDSAASLEAWKMTAGGHLNAVSIGALILQQTRIPAKTSAVVEGVTYTAGDMPLRVIQQFLTREVSLVVFGADEQARIQQQRARERSLVEMNEKLKAMMVRCGHITAGTSDADAQKAFAALSAEVQAVLQAASNPGETPGGTDPGETPGATNQGVTNQGVTNQGATAQGATTPLVVQQGASVADQIAQALAAERNAERDRVNQIEAEASEYGVGEAVVQRCIAKGMTLVEARKEFMKDLAQQRTAPVGANFNINTGKGGLDGTPDVVAAALCQSMGRSGIDNKAKGEAKVQQERVAEAAGKLNGIGPLEAARLAVQMSGRYPGVNKEEIVQQAFSSISFQNIMGTVVDRLLMAAYDEAPDTTIGLLAENEVGDFRTVERYGVDKAQTLDALPINAEPNDATFSDFKESGAPVRFAGKLKIDEIIIINDDAGAVNRSVNEFGYAAKRIRPNYFYWLLNDNPTMRDGHDMFDNTYHLNLPTGNALSAANLQAAITTMGKQYVTQGGEKIPLNISPRHLVVPQELGFTAAQLLQSVERFNNSENGTFNVLRDLGIELHVDDRIGANGAQNPITKAVATGSATNYYLFADPNQVPTFEVAYLRGRNKRPVVRRDTIGVGEGYGLVWDIQHVLMILPLDWKGGLKAAGA